MKKRIFALLFCAALIVGSAAFLVASVVFYDGVKEELKSGLRSESALIVQATASGAELVKLDLAAPGTRVSLIDKEGVVLYDSTGKYLKNHSTRPEFVAALKNGEGEAERKSDTVGQKSYYYARALPDGNVLRLSRESGALPLLLRAAGPVLPLFIAATMLLALILALIFGKMVLKPLETSLAELDLSGEEGEGMPMSYPEFEPFRARVLFQKKQVKRFISELHDEKSKVTDIIASMREGFILLDAERLILMMNSSAKRILRAGEEVRSGQDVVTVLRSPELLDTIERANNSARTEKLDREVGGRAYRFYVSRAEGGGTIIFIVDNTEIAKAERVRRDFAANVSHELKTPLTSISGFSEMIESGLAADMGEVQKMAGIIHGESQKLINLVGDIIRLSEIENVEKAALASVELSAVAEKAIDSVAKFALTRRVTILRDLEAVHIQGDETMIFELLYNLLDNAVKYNKEDGSVKISIKNEGEAAKITVADTGIGIGKEHLERIFERFYRVDKSRFRDTGGTGLGLSIVKHAAEFHGGRVEIKSEQNSGTTVSVTLPK